jgi:hypothetical protein
MKLLVFSENEKMIRCVQEDLEKTSHTLTTAGLSELSSFRDLDEFDGIIMDKKSWQRCSVLFKHFGILDLINQKPLLILLNISSMRSLKFRDSQQKTVSCLFPFKTEDFTFALEKLFSIPAET